MRLFRSEKTDLSLKFTILHEYVRQMSLKFSIPLKAKNRYLLSFFRFYLIIFTVFEMLFYSHLTV
jgi:uncharacterized protein YybS (DUF2232 family)